MKGWMIGLGIAAFITLAVSWQVSLWKECRQTNSWGYCMKVLSK